MVITAMLRFSDDGPIFPNDLVRALAEGDLVCLCGAGISAPQLPGFKGLVERCFEDLGLAMTAAEKGACREGRYEEALGALSRRLAKPEALTDAVCQALQAPADADLAHHRTILRLSRDLEGRALVVTTNFDTLLERALPPMRHPADVKAASYAGQALPLPGAARFDGIIHLHGRVEDEGLGLDRTPLVVMSDQYGDAYMRSGWASRFLFDLARCKTIVLVGYSASDAPVRYFLNVLEADRARFGDLKKVYALDAVAPGEDPDPRWTAVAVTPLPYTAQPDPVSGVRDHGALWRDLERLAELAERPRATRRAWVEAALRTNPEDVSALERERALWLLGSEDGADLWDLPATCIAHAAWFNILHETGLLAGDRAWVVAAWCARDFTDRVRVETAMAWCARLGDRLADELRRRLIQAEPPHPWNAVWRMMAVRGAWRGADILESAYAVLPALARPRVSHEDLRRAIRLLTPVMQVSPSRQPSARAERPDDVATLRLGVHERHGLTELREALLRVNRGDAVIALATGAMRATLEGALDAGLIDGDDDLTDFSVPAVEVHPQNDVRDGTVFLATLLSGLLPALAGSDRDAARRYAAQWRAFPGRTGRRLWLNALRCEVAFDADEAIAGVLDVNERDFWSSSRELPLTIRDRAGAASQALVLLLERRIRDEAARYFSRFQPAPGGVDWRPQAADQAVWLRLTMLDKAGALSSEGRETLEALRAGNEHLRRKVQDRDYFGSYIYPADFVAGNPSPIALAEPDDRLQVVRTSIASTSFEAQQGWGAYCRGDPWAALTTLRTGALDVEDAGLWRDLLLTVALLPEMRKGERAALAEAVFEALIPAEDAFLRAIIVDLVAVYMSHPREEPSFAGAWWGRLLRCAAAQERRATEAGERRQDWPRVSTAMLTEAAMIDVNRRRIGGGQPSRDELDRLNAAASVGDFFALAAFAHHAAFVLSVDGHEAGAVLSEAASRDDADGRDLRAIIVTSPTTGMALAGKLWPQIMRGVLEFHDGADDPRPVAAKVLAPAVAVIAYAPDAPSRGTVLADARKALRDGSPALREGAARCLADWCDAEANSAAFWRTVVAPLFAEVWPRDKRLKAERLSLHLVRLLMQAGTAFPEALAVLKPYLLPSPSALHFVKGSSAPDDWPHATLDLLWSTRAMDVSPQYFELAGLLDRIRAADPSLETDRRLQWLEQRAPRFA